MDGENQNNANTGANNESVGANVQNQNTENKPVSFDDFLNKPDELRHAYNKFRFDGDVSKPAFEDTYQTVKKYIEKVLPLSKD